MLNLRKASYLLVLALLCCKKPYNPPAITSSNSYLVVEGVINSGNDSTIITISKTVNLNAVTTLNPVIGAAVIVESDQNQIYQLTDINGNGHYSAASLNLSASQKYRLSINITEGNQYLSDFVPVKSTPPIDSVGYLVQNNGVQLYVNTHDPTNNTRYYRWDYDETWMFHSKYFSDIILDKNNNILADRADAQAVYHCFGNDASSNIVLGSTAKLTKDVVYQNPLTKIPITSEKFENKYSILVKQYALTADEYTFYQNLKKNTEQLGSIFDAQPSQLKGNIHNVTNANEVVIGYIAATNVQSKRIFISNNVIPPDTQPIYPYDCEQDTVLFSGDVQGILINPPYVYMPTIKKFDKRGNPIGYLYSTPICVDCTLRGTTTTPLFWK
jgi:hypothetical protein